MNILWLKTTQACYLVSCGSETHHGSHWAKIKVLEAIFFLRLEEESLPFISPASRNGLHLL